MKYLGKIYETTKTVGKKKYHYIDVRIENKELLAKQFKVGQFVAVSLEPVDAI